MARVKTGQAVSASEASGLTKRCSERGESAKGRRAGQDHIGGTDSRPRGRGPARPLTADQQRLVTENLGLVAVHIRKRVLRPGRYLSPDDYGDLFQSGCLGLIEAARQYRPERGIAFAAFALARIRTAIYTALMHGALVHAPRWSKASSLPSGGQEAAPGPAAEPAREGGVRRGAVERVKVLRLSVDPESRGGDDPVASLEAMEVSPRPRVDELIRARIEAAFAMAAEVEVGSKHGPASAALVSFVMDQRLRVPEPADRAPLRQIAERFRVSLSQVLQLERRLVRTVQGRLLGDSQLQLLRRWSRRLDDGGQAAIDDRMVRQLRAAAAEQFWTRLRQLAPSAREEMLRRLVREAGDTAVRGVFAALPADTADAVLTAALRAA